MKRVSRRSRPINVLNTQEETLRDRPLTQSTLLGQIFTKIELPQGIWQPIRVNEQICESICGTHLMICHSMCQLKSLCGSGKYLETLEAMTNDAAALNNWAIALKMLAVIKARMLIQLVRRGELAASKVPSLTWLFKSSYDKYCGK